MVRILHSYMMKSKENGISPAYDLTRSITYYGEHSTTVCGKGRDIKDDDLRKLASSFSLKESNVNEIIRDVKAASR